MDCSMPDFPVFHYLPELAQTHVRWVGDAIQPSHPLSPTFSFCLQSFPASGSFQMSWLFISGGRSTGDSASASVLPMNILDWSPLGWTGWISLQSKGLSRDFSNTTVQKHQFFWHPVAQIIKLRLQCRKPSFSPWVGKIPLEEERDTHSSILAWKIPWTGEPGGLQPIGSERVGHDWMTNTHSLLYGPTLTSIHDDWKNHSLD